MQPLGTTQLGTTELEITKVGLGAWAMGGGEWQGGWGTQDDGASVATILHAVELGVSWIDTAPAYGLGRAEEVVGAAVRSLPPADRPLLFTKCGLIWEAGERSVSNSLASASIRQECEESLRRLGCETLDLLQAHWPTWDDTPLEESWQTMADLVTEGKARYIGLSNFDVDDLQRCERIRHVDTYQPELNLIERAAAEALPWCRQHGTGVIVYSPMRSGLLTGRFSPERVASLPDDDWRATNEDFHEPKLLDNLALVDRLRPIAARLSVTLPELVIAWTIAWPGVDGAIVGARRPDQVDDWIGAGRLTLAANDLDEIGEAIEETGAGRGPSRLTRTSA
jgi:aryl-alcohol dehydrogenase-like predicted oxidoreductase